MELQSLLNNILPGKLALPGTKDYEESNGSYFTQFEIAIKPAIIAQPTTVEEVSSLVKAVYPKLKDQKIYLAIRGTGHTPFSGIAWSTDINYNNWQCEQVVQILKMVWLLTYEALRAYSWRRTNPMLPLVLERLGAQYMRSSRRTGWLYLEDELVELALVGLFLVVSTFTSSVGKQTDSNLATIRWLIVLLHASWIRMWFYYRLRGCPCLRRGCPREYEDSCGSLRGIKRWFE